MNAPAERDAYGPQGDGDMPVLRVRLFGDLDVRYGDGEVLTVTSGRARSLLGLLLTRGPAAQQRERLAYLLWPDSTEGQARTNLRHLLHTLRRSSPAVDRYLEVTTQTLRWRWELPCRVDVVAFDAAIARAGDTADDGTVAALREAIGLYTGDLLEGCDDEWLVEDRARLRDRFIAALDRAAALVAATGDQREAVRLGRMLVRCDVLREDTYRLLMRVHDAAGDRAAAVRVYHECVTTLQRELGVEPSEATKAAYEALMGSGAAGGAVDDEAVPGTGTELVGRRVEWQRLTQCWRDAEHGGARLVLVTGEAGVGKTRLVEELAAWGVHQGAAVAEARSYPEEGELGYGVAISWLRAPDVADHIRRLPPADLAVLARLLPELHEPGPAADPGLRDEAEERRRLFEAASRALAIPGRSTLLIADDVQWCDQQSLQLIHYLVRLDPGRRLLVVGTVRREDLDEPHPLGSLAAGLQVLDRTVEIALDRLPRADTEVLVRLLAPGDVDQDSVDRLWEETEGNPLFVVEALRAGWEQLGDRVAGLTPKLQAVIGARLGLLSAPARELLGVAATVGRAFTAEVVGRASGADPVVLARGLDELWRRGFIRERGINGYDFAHGKIREVAYDGMSPAGRRRNHVLIAETLVRTGHDPEAISGEVARHYDRGGRAEEALSWYLRAAAQAQRLDAHLEAVRLLGRADELAVSLPDGADRHQRELEVLSALPTPLAVVEGFASARLATTQDRLLELSRAAGVDPDPSLLRSLVMSNLCRRDFDGARAAARQLQESARRTGDDLLLVETEYLLGIGAFWAGAFESARRHFERVIDTFDAQHRTEHLLRFGHDPAMVCLSRLANTFWFLGRADEAERVCDEAVAMASDSGQSFSHGVVSVFAALLAIDLGDPLRFRRYVAALTDEAPHEPLRSATRALFGYLAVLDGNVDDGIHRIRAAVEASPVDHAPGQRATHGRVLLAAYDLIGEAEAGLSAADELLAMDDSRIWEAENRRLRAGFLAALAGPAAAVVAELDRAAVVARRQGAPGLERRVERSRAELAARR